MAEELQARLCPPPCPLRPAHSPLPLHAPSCRYTQYARVPVLLERASEVHSCIQSKRPRMLVCGVLGIHMMILGGRRHVSLFPPLVLHGFVHPRKTLRHFDRMQECDSVRRAVKHGRYQQCAWWFACFKTPHCAVCVVFWVQDAMEGMGPMSARRMHVSMRGGSGSGSARRLFAM